MGGYLAIWEDLFVVPSYGCLPLRIKRPKVDSNNWIYLSESNLRQQKSFYLLICFKNQPTRYSHEIGLSTWFCSNEDRAH